MRALVATVAVAAVTAVFAPSAAAAPGSWDASTSVNVSAAAPGKDVGIGTPLEMTLPIKVTGDRARQQIADATVVLADGAPVTGWWWWPDARTARFVPDEFWPGDATVTARVNFDQVDTKRAPITGSATGTLRTSQHIWARVNGAKQTMTVFVDGEKARTIDVSTGGPGKETRVGTKLIMDRHDGYTLRGPASDPYVIPVDYAMRITATGEIIHSAPWASYRLGVRPGSGGCTNTSVADARWLYNNVDVGTPVRFHGTGGERQTPTNGWGDWNVPESERFAVRLRPVIPPALR